ncbi:uncharacterized protein LOC126672965 [Mercurialis annua]|uniref:uncharacterized protein LOC126672965 n=1 Tax=Mercurialis annua TaxID=3986 RepID=UPI00215F5BEC|nr:uncharacterized protein LOC126672965 [Mercurialis annua]
MRTTVRKRNMIEDARQDGAMLSKLLESHFSHTWTSITEDLTFLDNSLRSTAIFCFVLWALWKARNEVIFNDNWASVVKVVDKAISFSQEFEAVSEKMEETSPSLDTQDCPIDVPSQVNLDDASRFHIIIQYDVGTSAQHKFSSVAGVAKDSSDKIMGQFSAIFRIIWDPGIMEFLALREAMIWSLKNNWKSVRFEGDAILVSHSINSGISSSIDNGNICQDIWQLTKSFDISSFYHISRTTNTKAHNLAQVAKARFVNWANPAL